jgi:hypothetical protein
VRGPAKPDHVVGVVCTPSRARFDVMRINPSMPPVDLAEPPRSHLHLSDHLSPALERFAWAPDGEFATGGHAAPSGPAYHCHLGTLKDSVAHHPFVAAGGVPAKIWT